MGEQLNRLLTAYGSFKPTLYAETVNQSIDKFPSFYRIRRFVTISKDLGSAIHPSGKGKG